MVACIVRCLFVALFISYFIADSFLVDASSLIQNAANRMITMEITESFRRDDIVIDTTLPLLLKLSRKSPDKYLRFIVSFCVHWSRSTYCEWGWKEYHIPAEDIINDSELKVQSTSRVHHIVACNSLWISIPPSRCNSFPQPYVLHNIIVILTQATTTWPDYHLNHTTRRREATTSIKFIILSYCRHLLALFVVVSPHPSLLYVVP